MTDKPTLKYRWLDEDGADVVLSEGTPLFTVREVSCSEWSGELNVYVEGRMRKRNGEPGPSRHGRVDLDAIQPYWLAALITDASRRLRPALREATDD